MTGTARDARRWGVQNSARARSAHAVFVTLVAVAAVVAALWGRRPASLVVTSIALVVFGLGFRTVRETAPAWRAVLVGMAVLTFDAACSVVLPAVTGDPGAAASITTVALPVGFAGLLAGSILLVSPRGRRHPGAVIDTALVAVTATTVLWAVLLRPHLDAVAAGPVTVVGTVLVLLIFGGMTGALARAWISQETRHAGLGYVLLSAAAGLVGNALKALTAGDDPSGAPWWIAILWAVAYGGLAAASLHPSSVAVAPPPPDERLTPWRLVHLGLALITVPAIVGTQAALGRHVDGILVAASAAVVVPLVLARVAILARLYHSAQERLAHLAEHDELTGLPNRRAVTAHLHDALARVAAGRSPGAVVAFVDLDDFKSVNDGLGHPTGDRLLRAVSERLRARLRGTDVLARFGGDEFLVVCEGDPDHLEQRVRDVLDGALAEPFDLGGTVLDCRASLGTFVVHPGTTPHLDEVLSAADAAMYREKGRAPGRLTRQAARSR